MSTGTLLLLDLSARWPVRPPQVSRPEVQSNLTPEEAEEAKKIKAPADARSRQRSEPRFGGSRPSAPFVALLLPVAFFGVAGESQFWRQVQRSRSVFLGPRQGPARVSVFSWAAVDVGKCNLGGVQRGRKLNLHKT